MLHVHVFCVVLHIIIIIGDVARVRAARVALKGVPHATVLCGSCNTRPLFCVGVVVVRESGAGMEGE